MVKSLKEGAISPPPGVSRVRQWQSDQTTSSRRLKNDDREKYGEVRKTALEMCHTSGQAASPISLLSCTDSGLSFPALPLSLHAAIICYCHWSDDSLARYNERVENSLFVSPLITYRQSLQ